MLQTPLYQVHLDSGARMVDFAGWSMPLLYTSLLEEHVWTRQNIGLFDVSHMGRLEVNGPAAVETLESLCTRTIMDLPINSTRYCLMCNDQGGILDDLMVSRLEPEKYYVVCNAGNREKIIDHIEANLKTSATLVDRTLQTAMLALQGPKVAMLLSKLIPGPLAELTHRKVFVDKLMGIPVMIFRGGYTGEDGFEVVLPAYVASMAWAQLLSLNLNDGPVVKPAGLGARDTLRLEAALPLYGHELTEQIDPLTAKLDFAVDFDHDFIGKEALEKIRQSGPSQLRIGLKMQTRRTARQGSKILSNGRQVGTITSGAFTPTASASIAQAYIQSDLAQVGKTVKIQFNNDLEDAEIVPLPFYKRTK
ncbi:MAG: glycine cleavage system aminomethyltransferase GcvT [Phycisphaerae bacterium]